MRAKEKEENAKRRFEPSLPTSCGEPAVKGDPGRGRGGADGVNCSPNKHRQQQTGG